MACITALPAATTAGFLIYNVNLGLSYKLLLMKENGRKFKGAIVIMLTLASLSFVDERKF